MTTMIIKTLNVKGVFGHSRQVRVKHIVGSVTVAHQPKQYNRKSLHSGGGSCGLYACINTDIIMISFSF